MGWLKSTGAIGLEIDTGIIRVVELQGTEKAVSLLTIAQKELPIHAVAEGMVVDVNAVATALQEIWEQYRFGQREVILGICNQGVFLRYTTFPKISEKKLASAIRFKAREYFPIDLAEMVFDYAVLGEQPRGLNPNPTLEILLVAVRKDTLKPSLQTLEMCNLQPKIVDVTFLALLRTLTKEQLTGSFVLVDLANGLTTIQLISRGVPRFSRVISHSLQTYAREMNLPLGEDTLLAQPLVAATLEEDLQYAGYGLPDDWGLTLANEIRSSVSYYLAQDNAGSVDTVILSGRGAKINGLADRLREELGVQVEILNPLAGLKEVIPEIENQLGEQALEYASCLGLALRGLGAK